MTTVWDLEGPLHPPFERPTETWKIWPDWRTPQRALGLGIGVTCVFRVSLMSPYRAMVHAVLTFTEVERFKNSLAGYPWSALDDRWAAFKLELPDPLAEIIPTARIEVALPAPIAMVHSTLGIDDIMAPELPKRSHLEFELDQTCYQRGLAVQEEIAAALVLIETIRAPVDGLVEIPRHPRMEFKLGPTSGTRYIPEEVVKLVDVRYSELLMYRWTRRIGADPLAFLGYSPTRRVFLFWGNREMIQEAVELAALGRLDLEIPGYPPR